MEYQLATLETDRLAWVEVDSGVIEQNTRVLQSYVGHHVAILGVVKADGYGHGAAIAARALQAGGAAGVAVATVGEGRRLRAEGINAPILVLGYTPPEQIEEAVSYDLALMVGAAETLYAAAAVGRAAGRAVRLHLKVDTGMHRLGLMPHEVMPFLDSLHGTEGIVWEGIFTHFASADEPFQPQTEQQIACFEQILAATAASGWQFPIAHASNSAGTLCFPRAHYDAVRTGIAVYGVAPAPEVALPRGMHPALAFRTRVVRVAELPAGHQVSYGGVYTTAGPCRIATIAAGYADGVRRSPPWREVLLHGTRAPIVGRVCMDYAMLDVTHLPHTAVGDEVTLLGAQGDACITAEEVGCWLGTSAYEVLTTIVPGEPRVTPF